MYCSTDWCARSQKEAVQSGMLSRHVRELYLMPTADGLPASSLRPHLVLRTRFGHQEPNPIMPYGKLGRAAKLITMLVVHARIWSTIPWYGLQQAITLHVGNRLLIIQNKNRPTIPNRLFNPLTSSHRRYIFSGALVRVYFQWKFWKNF